MQTVFPEVFDDGFAYAFAKNPRAGEIAIKVEGTFVDADIGVIVKLLEDNLRFCLIEQKTIKIYVEFVICGYDFADGFDLLEDVSPGTGFHFERSVPPFERFSGLRDPVGR